jgi:tetratricopeptide (TPR) repeat protein
VKFYQRYNILQRFSFINKVFLIYKELVTDFSKIDKLINRAVSVIENSPDISLSLLQRASSLSEELNYLSGKAISALQIGRTYIVLGNYEESNKYLEKAVKCYEELSDTESQITTLSLLGMNHSFLGKYDEAFSFFEKSLALAERLGNDNLTAKVINNLGNLYYSIDDLDSARSYYLKSIPLKEKVGDLKGLGAAYTNLALISTGLKDLDKAEEYINKSIEIKKNFRDNIKDEASFAFAKNIQGSIKKSSGDYHSALKFFEEVLDIYLRQNNIFMLCETYLLIASTYIEMKDKGNALKCLNAAEEFIRQINAVRISDEFELLHKKISSLK